MRFLYTDFPRLVDADRLLLRLVIAAVFLNAGFMKLGMWQQGIPEGMPAAMVTIMKVLAIAEPLAALSLVLGLFTRTANIGLMIVMVSALYVKITSLDPAMSFGEGMGIWQIDLVLLACNITLFILGPGRYSLDSMFIKPRVMGVQTA